MEPIVPSAINWIWQASLLTAAVALVVRVCPPLSASTRERIWWMALVANVVLLVAAFSRGPAPIADVVRTAAAPPIVLPPMGRWPLVMGTAWALWIVVHLVRVAAGMAAVVHAIRRTTRFPREREAALTVWNRVRWTQPAVRLAVSPLVRHAAVLGWRRPIIAVAPDTLARLSDREIDQVLVHELAHVRRGDCWALVVQRVIGAVIGFHPAIWWIDRAIRLERERACDDFVLAAGGSSKQYGACLLKLVEASRGISLAPGAALARGDMSKRIGYLLEPGRNRSFRGSPKALATAVAVVALLTLVCASTDLAAYPRRVVAALQLDVVLSGNIASTAATIMPPAPSRPAAAIQPMPVAATGQAGLRVEDTIRPLDATGFGVHVPVDAPQAPLPSIEARAVVGHLSPPLTATAVHLDLSRDVPEVATGATTPSQTPWQALADAGKAVGAGSRRAGVGTGRAFTRFGRSLAGVF